MKEKIQSFNDDIALPLLQQRRARDSTVISSTGVAVPS